MVTASPQLRIDRRSRRLFLNGDELELTPTEWKVVLDISSDPGRAYSWEDILPGYGVGYKRLVAFRLRAKIGHTALTSLRGYGLRLEAEVSN